MGLLTVGTPLSWDETKKLGEHVRRHGITQFLNLYRRAIHREDTEFRFGDEIEYILVHFDEEERRVRLLLNAGDILDILQEKERNAAEPHNLDTLWRPEFAGYMIEGTPGQPYCTSLQFAGCVEHNMRLRRKEVTNHFPANCAVLTLTAFPRLGCPDFCTPSTPCTPEDPNGVTRSLFFPDGAIFGRHPRFANLTRNIRQRRGEKVAINCPLFRDKLTPWPFHEQLNVDAHSQANGHKEEHWTQREHCGAARPNSVYLDALGFGMGMCCLQVTFQARNVTSARALYDQLVPVAPLMLALTAATPITRGYLLDTDARWYIISGAVDDRTPGERGYSSLACASGEAECDKQKLTNGSSKSNGYHERRMPKSRYDSVDMYLTEAAARYNDVPVVYNERDYDELVAGGVDSVLAKHVAHLFARDSVSLFAERVEQDDETETDHFENLQSTNWQSLRFKPPPSSAPDSPIGWRVEFRSMEVQPSDMSNAAFTNFIMLLTRTIKTFGLNLCMPMSKVDANMHRAQERDACRQQRFYWRRNVLPRGFSLNDDSLDQGRQNLSEESSYEVDESDAEVEEMSIDEIFNGSERFAGLIPLIRKYLRVASSNPASPTVGSPHSSSSTLSSWAGTNGTAQTQTQTAGKDKQRESGLGCMGGDVSSGSGSGSSIGKDSELDDKTNAILERHLNFIGARASGKLPTVAQLLRRFVRTHADYRHDSVVTESIAFDLCKLAVSIANDKLSETSLTDSYEFFQSSNGETSHNDKNDASL